MRRQSREWWDGSRQGFQSRTRFLNPGIRDWGISNPGIPAGLWDPRGMISKTVIIEYNWLYIANFASFVTESQAYA